MPGLFVIAHTPLASAFAALAGHTYDDLSQTLAAYDVPAGDDVEDYLAQAGAVLDGMASPEVLLITDVFGATPCNIARRLAEARGLRLVVGLNLPMLWRALNYRHRPLEELASLAAAGGTQGVMQLNATRPQNQANKPANHDPNDGHHQQ